MNKIVEYLSHYEEFKDILPKIDEDINKKGYSIFQVLSNLDIAKIVYKKEGRGALRVNLLPTDKFLELLDLQNSFTFILLQNKIFFLGNWYDAERIGNVIFEYKKFLENHKLVGYEDKKIEKFDSYGKNIYIRPEERYIFTTNYLPVFFGIFLLPIIFVVLYCIFFIFIVIFSYFNWINIYNLTQPQLTFIKFLFFVGLCIGFYNFGLKALFFPSIQERLKQMRIIYNETQKTNFLYQLKSIDDDITSIENLNLGKINLLNSFESDLSSLKNYEILTSQISNLLISISQKLQNFNSNQINKSEILAFATQNFDIVIKNWISVLSNIQSDISKINSEASSENQKLFVKTTDDLNANIGVTIRELETLKI